jgi:hypothetical protein
LIPLIELCIHQINEDSSKINKLEERVACLEKEQRRKNIVLFGVPTDAYLNAVVDNVILKKLSRQKQPLKKISLSVYIGSDKKTPPNALS